MRLALPLAACAVAFLATDASAHVGYKIQLTAVYKETKKGDVVFRNVFVTGHAHYPDGTVLKVGIRPESMSTGYLQWVAGQVRKEEFVAEMGPWRVGFPPGKYVCEAWFNFETQPESVKADLNMQEEYAKCLKDNPAYQEEYKKANPERYERLMKQITAQGRCASYTQYGACELNVGTADDAAQAEEIEKAFIRDHIEISKEMLKELIQIQAKHLDPDRNAAVNQEAFAAWATEWQDVVTKSDSEIAERIGSVVVSKYSDLYGDISTALTSMSDLKSSIESAIYGETAKKNVHLAALVAKGESVAKDEKRLRDQLKKDIEASNKSTIELQQRTLESLASALHGKTGLEPSPERKAKLIEALKQEHGFEWP